MERKTLSGLTIKNADRGEISAVFATFDVVDHDGDVVERSAFDDGQEVVISAYGHRSWDGALPVGRGTITTTPKEAVLHGRFFMETQHGKDTFLTVKEVGDLQEYSWGFDITKHSYEERDGKQVRILHRVDLHEVSPVLRGASIGTRTLAAKSAGPGVAVKAGRPVAPHECETTSRSWDGAKTVAGLGDDLRPSELRTVFAWQDTGADPELKSSYQMPHHHGVGGPANVRACLMGIARLNDGKAAIPDADRKAVYDHLAAHLRDADIEPPELKDSPGGSLKYAEEGHAVMAAVSAFVDRTAEVVALRAAKGRGMAPRSADLLDWIDADLQRLKSLLSIPLGPEDPSEADIASVFARSIAQLQDL
jgi:HK97 family phage prohead protease